MIGKAELDGLTSKSALGGRLKRGFSLVEAISTCPTVYGRMNRQPTGLDQMKYYRENSVIRHGADPRDVGIDLNGKIIVGKFVDIERPTFSDLQEEILRKTSGDEPPAKTASIQEAKISVRQNK